MDISYPMTFRIENKELGLYTHVGVQEFSADEGTCIVPAWLLEHLALPATDGGIVEITNVTLPSGTFVKMQPLKQTFLDIHNHRAVLERCLRTYTALTVGDVISLEHAGTVHQIEIRDAKPSSAILIVEADVQVDFEAPKDYVEPPRVLPTTQASQASLPVDASRAALPSPAPSMATLRRVDGKVLQVDSSALSFTKQTEEEELDPEPWKKALKGGVRAWDHGFDMLVREGRVPGVLGSSNGRPGNDAFKGRGTALGMQ